MQIKQANIVIETALSSYKSNIIISIVILTVFGVRIYSSGKLSCIDEIAVKESTKRDPPCVHRVKSGL
jgi:hypothetical protein